MVPFASPVGFLCLVWILLSLHFGQSLTSPLAKAKIGSPTAFDLKTWNDRSKGTQTHREVFTDAMSRIVAELEDGAKYAAQDPENMQVLCLLISADIWMRESNIVMEPLASFELFELIQQGAEEAKKMLLLPHGVLVLLVRLGLHILDGILAQDISDSMPCLGTDCFPASRTIHGFQHL